MLHSSFILAHCLLFDMQPQWLIHRVCGALMFPVLLAATHTDPDTKERWCKSPASPCMHMCQFASPDGSLMPWCSSAMAIRSKRPESRARLVRWCSKWAASGCGFSAPSLHFRVQHQLQHKGAACQACMEEPAVLSTAVLLRRTPTDTAGT